jgi:hypothetical protein
MADDPKIRASDEDRDRTAALLREHHAVGRLTPEEFAERLDKVYTAKTVGELEELLADLPGIDLYRLPDASVRRHRPIPGGTSHMSALQTQGGVLKSAGVSFPAWQVVWGSWLSVSLLCLVIWAASGAGYPWFLWVAGPLGIAMLGRKMTGGGHDRRRHRRPHGDPDQAGGTAPGP